MTPDVATLRQFHFTGSASGIESTAPAAYLPALLFPFRDPERVRTDYPLFLPATVDPAGTPCQPLRTALNGLLADRSPGQVLRDNLTRLEVHTRRVLDGGDGSPRSARGVLAAAADALVAELGLQPEARATLTGDLAALTDAIPDGAELLPASSHAPLHLFVAAARQRLRARRAEFARELRELCAEFESVLRVERAKDPSAHGAEQVKEEVGTAGAALIDTGRLAEVVGGHRGTRAMGAASRRRIEEALAAAQRYLAADDSTSVVVVGRDLAGFECGPDVVAVQADDPCVAAVERFDALAEEWAELFRAVRRGRLALDHRYDPDRHDAWASSFRWPSFRADELQALPCVVAVEAAPALVADHLADLSRLLLSGRPVHVLVAQDPARDPATPQGDGGGYRLELAYLAMAHREALVQQSTAGRPEHLLAGYHQALAGDRAALTVVDEFRDGTVGPWLHSRAAVESRAHPLFRYDPGRGPSWARRFSCGGNPEPTIDWSVQELDYEGVEGPAQGLSLAFTIADYALLEADYAGQFTALPGAFESDELVALADYLELSDDEALPKLPFVWGVDRSGQLTRLVVTIRMVRMVRERLGFWRGLQDLAGVRSETVDLAVAEAVGDAEARFAEERAALAEAHAAELAAVRESAAGEAMQGLAQMLLDTDLGALAAGTVAAPVGAPSAPAAPVTRSDEPLAVVEVPEAPAAAAQDDEAVEEPWVETVLCTSCNDCVTLNPKMFVYDDNKQVYLGDPKAGPYKQLVEAAEKCPANCIHPGLPLDKNEPGLEDLIRRAEPFN